MALPYFDEAIRLDKNNFEASHERAKISYSYKIQLMLTSLQLRSQVDALWDKFWSGGTCHKTYRFYSILAKQIIPKESVTNE